MSSRKPAVLAAVVFVDLNSAVLLLTEDDAFALVMDVAQGPGEVTEIARRLRLSD